MKLITELTEEVQYITEATENGKKNLYIEGTFLVCNEPNRNNRIYEMKTMRREVDRYMKEYVEKGRAFGELGHPNGPSINLDRVSHLITSLKEDGNKFVGRARITETPMGNIARGLIESGAQLGVSSRGMGSLRAGKNGIMEVQDDFYLATAADIVADPSAPGAFVQGIMEGVEWVWDNGIIKAQEVEEMHKKIKGSSKRKLEETKIEVFEKFLKLL